MPQSDVEQPAVPPLAPHEGDPPAAAAAAAAERPRNSRRRLLLRSGTFASLANREFRQLWLGLLLMFAGSQVRMVASGYLAYELTASPLVLGLVGVSFSVPMLLLGLLGGAAADRFDRRRILQIGQGLFALAALFIAVIISIGAVTWVHLMMASVVQGVLWSLIVPARQAMIPQIVGRRLMTNGLALMSGAFSLTTLMGPALGGLLYAWIGPAGAYYAVAVTGLGAVLITGRMRATSAQPRGTSAPGSIREGLAYVRGQPVILLLLVMALSYALLANPFRLLLPVFVVDVYGRGPGALGLLVSAMGLGSVAAAVAIASMRAGRRGLVLLLGGILAGAAIMMMAAMPLFALGLVGMLGLGVGDAIRKTLNQTLMLEIAEPEYHGRLASIFMLTFGLMPLGAMPASALAEAFGGRVAGAAMAGCMLVVSVALLANRRLRRLT